MFLCTTKPIFQKKKNRKGFGTKEYLKYCINLQYQTLITNIVIQFHHKRWIKNNIFGDIYTELHAKISTESKDKPYWLCHIAKWIKKNITKSTAINRLKY